MEVKIVARGKVNISNASLGFKNFSGAEGQYNRKGDRNFVVFLETEDAQMLEQQGWNIKWPKPNPNIEDDMDSRNPYLPVSLSFNAKYPNLNPKIVLIAGNRINVLSEEELDMLDWAEIENADLVLRPYNWAVNGNTGIKAYLDAGYITIVVDEFSDKYGI